MENENVEARSSQWEVSFVPFLMYTLILLGHAPSITFQVSGFRF